MPKVSCLIPSELVYVFYLDFLYVFLCCVSTKEGTWNNRQTFPHHLPIAPPSQCLCESNKLRALSYFQRNLLPTPTHVSLLVCTRRKAVFSCSKPAPLNLRPERRVGEKQRRVPAQMMHIAILRINEAVVQLTNKYLV